MLFRFLEYNYLNEEDQHEDARVITGIVINENYDTFYKLLHEHIGKDIVLKNNEWYHIDKIVLSYSGDEDQFFCINVYCIGVW